MSNYAAQPFKFLLGPLWRRVSAVAQKRDSISHPSAEPVKQDLFLATNPTDLSAPDVAHILSSDMQGVMMQKLGLITPEQAAKVDRMKDFLHLIDERIKSGGLSDEQVAFLENKKILKDGKVQNMSGLMFGIKNIEESIAEFGFDAKDFEGIQAISRSGAPAPPHIPPSGVIIKWSLSGSAGAKELEAASLILQQAGRGLDSILRLAGGEPDVEVAQKYNQFDKMNAEKDGPVPHQIQLTHKAVNSFERNHHIHGFSFENGLPWVLRGDAEKLMTGYGAALSLLQKVQANEKTTPELQDKLADFIGKTRIVHAHYIEKIASVDPNFAAYLRHKSGAINTPAPSAEPPQPDRY